MWELKLLALLSLLLSFFFHSKIININNLYLLFLP